MTLISQCRFRKGKKAYNRYNPFKTQTPKQHKIYLRWLRYAVWVTQANIDAMLAEHGKEYFKDVIPEHILNNGWIKL